MSTLSSRAATATHGPGMRFHHLRPPASQYSPDMSKHYALGDDPTLKKLNLDYAEDL